MAIRRASILLAATVVAVTLVSVGPAGAAQGGGGCQLQGQANLSPPLGSSSAPFNYSFTGALSTCQSYLAAPRPRGTSRPASRSPRP